MIEIAIFFYVMGFLGIIYGGIVSVIASQLNELKDIIMGIIIIILSFIIITIGYYGFNKYNPQYNQVITYKPKQIIDSLGNNKTIYIPIDTIYIKK